MNLSETEKWIPGFKDKYLASWDGRIFRECKNGKIYELKGYKKGNCYCVKLSGKEFLFNRIIWETFKGPIPADYLVVKKIPILKENGMANLRLRTKVQHGRKTGPTSRSKQVVLLDDERKVVDYWASARKAAKDLFLSYQTVIDYCNEKVRRPLVNVRWARKMDFD